MQKTMNDGNGPHNCSETGLARLLGYWRRRREQDEDSQPITNTELMKRIGIGTVQTELRIRRLKWLQSMVEYPKENADIIAAVFGSLMFERQRTIPPPLDADGRILIHSHSWLKQLAEDMQTLCENLSQW